MVAFASDQSEKNIVELELVQLRDSSVELKEKGSFALEQKI